MYQLSNRSLGRLEGIDRVLISILKFGIKNSPYDFAIPQHGGLRTAEEQNDLFKRGVSKCDGYDKESYHQTGKAFDIYIYEDGNASWDIDKLTAVARHLEGVATEIGVDLQWGGDWISWKDYPHFQIKRG